MNEHVQYVSASRWHGTAHEDGRTEGIILRIGPEPHTGVAFEVELSYEEWGKVVAPFARVLYIETIDGLDASQASELGSKALDELYEREGTSVDLLNWYAEEVK